MTALGTILRRFVSALCGVVVVAAPVSAQDRGELLYATHCGACHTAQMHWRASRSVTDWPSLKVEVHKWQVVASLGWTEDEVLDVARYLNDSIYHFDQTNGRLSSTRVCEELSSHPVKKQTMPCGAGSIPLTALRKEAL